jgi:hypothetical protein
MAARPRKKPPPQTTANHLTTLEKAIRTLSYGRHLFTIFRHFVELSALALSNAADPINRTAREAQYLSIVKQYKPEEVQQFPLLLAMLVDALELEPTDVLGVLYITVWSFRMNRQANSSPHISSASSWPRC